MPDTYAYVAGSALRDDIKSPGYFVFHPARLPTAVSSWSIVAMFRSITPPSRRRG